MWQNLKVCLPAQGRWLMVTEELGQVYQATAPFPLWFRYLVTYQESDGAPGLTLGVLLALLYLILKVTFYLFRFFFQKCCKCYFKDFLFSAFRIVQPVDVFSENCEDFSSRQGQ